MKLRSGAEDLRRAERLKRLLALRNGRRLLKLGMALGIDEIRLYRLRRDLKRRAEALGARLFIGPMKQRPRSR